MPSVRSPLTLRQWSGGAYLAGILLLAVGVVFALGRHLDDHFRRELSDRGRALVERLAEDSRLALIQAESDSLRPRLETALADPNVAGIVVATARGETLAAAGPNPLPPGAAFPAGDGLRVAETEQTLTLVAAVRPHPLSDDYFARGATGAAAEPAAPLGFVALTLTKAKLQSDLRAIGRYVLAVMGAGALLVTLLALGVLDRLTRPIKQLARTMADPEAVRHWRQVEVRGVREARVIATAYNALIARVADSQADLARQVEEAVREVMQQNAELIVAREQAEAASRVKSQFVANMSHEIRTPMHGFLGFLDMLGETPLTQLQRSHWRLLKHSVTNLLVVINKILDFSRLEAGKIELQSQPFNLRKTLDNTVQLFTPNARAKGLKLLLAVEPNTPERAIGDRQHLTQILCNLIDNAIKFTRRGSIRVSAQAAPGSDPSFFQCRLSVQDTGIGIPKTHQQKISSCKFFRDEILAYTNT
jgi:two-component system sensor histidine kinase BarA